MATKRKSTALMKSSRFDDDGWSMVMMKIMMTEIMIMVMTLMNKGN